MNPETKRPRSLAAAIPLLLMTSLMAFAPASAETVEEADALMDQLQRNLDLAGALTQADDAFAAAKLATAWQAATLGVELESAVAPQHDAPSAAVLALVERHGVAPTADQAAQIAALDDLPASQRDALTGVVDAFLALEDATRVAYQDADPDALAALAEDAEVSEAGPTALADAGVQVGLILGTRNDFLDATQAFQDAFSGLGAASTASAGPGVDLCPALALDLDGLDTTYNDECALTLDVGGHDVYLNNAGGAGTPLGTVCSLVNTHAAAAAVDLDGDDQYISGANCGTNGGGDLGVGFLLDQGGNDTYTAGDIGTNGGGGLGVGFLLDQAGNDGYSAGDSGTNGGGDFGVGLLWDQGGTDEYLDSDGGTGTDRTVVPKGLVGAQVDTGPVTTREDPDGSVTVFVDSNGNDEPDEGEEVASTPGSDRSDGAEERTLFSQQGISVGGQELPPEDVPGQPVPDFPGQPVPDVPGQQTPDVPGQEVPDVPGQEVPDHEGTEPVPTPPVDQPVGTLSTRDSADGTNYCVFFTPEGGSEQEVACVGKAFLQPVENVQPLPRDDTELVFHDPPDVPGTPPVATPDVPPTTTPDVPPKEVPDVPPVTTPDAPPVTTPNVPPTPAGSLGAAPEITIDVNVTYAFDPDRLTPAVSVLGQQTWSPVGPSQDDVLWLALHGDQAALTVRVTVYEDGDEVDTVEHSVPVLGQALAAAEATAGTL